MAIRDLVVDRWSGGSSAGHCRETWALAWLQGSNGSCSYGRLVCWGRGTVATPGSSAWCSRVRLGVQDADRSCWRARLHGVSSAGDRLGRKPCRFLALYEVVCPRDQSQALQAYCMAWTAGDKACLGFVWAAIWA